MSNYEFDKAVLKIWLQNYDNNASSSVFLNIFLKRCALDRIYTATTTILWKILYTRKKLSTETSFKTIDLRLNWK